MKIKLFVVFLTLFTFSIAKAQRAESISELTPVSPNIGKFTKNVPKARYSIYEDEKVKFDVKTEPINLPDGNKAVSVIIQVSGAEVVFENIGGWETAKVRFYGRITSKDKKTDGFFEENLITTATVEDLSNVSKLKPIILRKVFNLPPGKYQIGIIVRDILSGARGVKIIKFQIP